MGSSSCHPDYREAGMQNGEQVANFLRFIALLTSVSVFYPWLDSARRNHMKIFCLHWFSGVVYVVSQFAMTLMVINCWSSHIAGPFIFFLKFVELTAVNLGAITSLAIAVLIASVVQAFSRMRLVPRVIGTSRVAWWCVATSVGLTLLSAPFWNDIVVTGSYFWVTNSSNVNFARWISLSFVTTQTAAGLLMAVVLVFMISGGRRKSLRVCLKTSKRINLYFVLTVLGTFVYAYNGVVLLIIELAGSGPSKKQLIMVGWCSRFVHVIADTLVLYHAFQGQRHHQDRGRLNSSDCPNCGAVGDMADLCVGEGSNACDDDIERNTGCRFAHGRVHSSISSSGSFIITGVGTKFRVASSGGGDVGDGVSRSSSGRSSNGGRRSQASIEGSRFRKAVAALAMRSRSFSRHTSGNGSFSLHGESRDATVDDANRAETGSGATTTVVGPGGDGRHDGRTSDRNGDAIVIDDASGSSVSPTSSSSLSTSPSVTTASFHSYSSTSSSSSSSDSCCSFSYSTASCASPSASAWPPSNSTSVAAFSSACAMAPAPSSGKAVATSAGRGGRSSGWRWKGSAAAFPAASNSGGGSGAEAFDGCGNRGRSSTEAFVGCGEGVTMTSPLTNIAGVGVGAVEALARATAQAVTAASPAPAAAPPPPASAAVGGAAAAAGAVAKGKSTAATECAGESRGEEAGGAEEKETVPAAAAAAPPAPGPAGTAGEAAAAGAATKSKKYAASILSARRRAAAASVARRRAWQALIKPAAAAAAAEDESRTAGGAEGDRNGGDSATSAADDHGDDVSNANGDRGSSSNNVGRRDRDTLRTTGDTTTTRNSTSTAASITGSSNRSIRELHRHVAQQHRLLRRPPRIRTIPASALPPRPRPGATAVMSRGGRGSSGGIGGARSTGVGRNRTQGRGNRVQVGTAPLRRPGVGHDASSR